MVKSLTCLIPQCKAAISNQRVWNEHFPMRAFTVLLLNLELCETYISHLNKICSETCHSRIRNSYPVGFASGNWNNRLNFMYIPILCLFSRLYGKGKLHLVKPGLPYWLSPSVCMLRVDIMGELYSYLSCYCSTCDPYQTCLFDLMLQLL